MKLVDKILSVLSDLPVFSNQLFLACSGGRDSLSLAFACYLLHQKGELQTLPTLLHVHHGMQKANDDWANLVKTWSQDLGFTCHILPISLDKKTETAARDGRYMAMANLMGDNDILLLAHHQNDQAETVLMRLINGAGASGLGGIKKYQEKSINGKKIILYRPFLTISRDEISDFAQFYQLPFVDDPSNETGENLRSIIRTKIMPILNQLNPKTVQNIARASQHLTEADLIVKQTITQHIQDCLIQTLTVPPYQSVLDIDKIKGLDKTIQKTLVHQWLQGDEVLPPNHQLVLDVLVLINRQNPDHQTQIFWQGKKNAFIVCRYQNRLYRYHHAVWDLLQFPPCAVTNQNHQTVLKLSDELIFWLSLPKNINVRPLQKTDKIQYHQHTANQAMMNWQLSGKKLYQTLKIPSWLRDNLWLICHQDKPLYLISVFHLWQLEKSEVSHYFLLDKSKLLGQLTAL